MAISKNEEKKYVRRQRILLVSAGVLVVALISVILYFSLSSGMKDISHDKEAGSSAASAGSSDSVENKANMSFKESSIKMETGETLVPELSGGSIDDLENWQSTDPSVVSVDAKGSITGVSAGLAAVSAQVKNSDTLLNLSVTVTESSSSEATAAEETTVATEAEASADKTSKGFEIVKEDGKTYIDGILMASKTYTLPEDYAPGEEPEMLEAFDKMQNDAANEGLSIYISSGFRSYRDQDRIYNNYVAADGKEAADRYSSRPGHSDHQTGLAIDLNSIDDSFADTRESDWVKENCHKYGFIVRYPEGKEDITGYKYEPWHLRYIGIEKATKVYESGLSLEEYLGVTSDYADCETE